MTPPYSQPSSVTHDQGEIIVDGPDGVAVSLTPEAALITAGRLETEAIEALLERGKTVVTKPVG
ncbi:MULTISPECIES: hypothetical protein [Sphingomonas]|uniref:Uncharacterized protein n=1 Tax=Sphingomonas kyungheensis TaxID=1069987 RepID=A0ABU8H118_9SPHN|nr:MULTISPECIES: hypothetical protein [unclassified Sphingomonas]EZP57356.1 hypothetical protein BW41_00201 [Sphingomonas sp. RIT328]